MTVQRSRARALVATPFALAMACGGASSGSEPEAPATAQPAPEPKRTAAENRDLRRMLVDLAAGSACQRLAGELVGLSASAKKKDGEGSGPTTGRLWVERCSAERVQDDRVRLELEGSGWRWIDREDETLGARFGVSQYVRFDTKLQATVTVDVAYARSKHRLTLMVTPTEPIRAQIVPTSGVDANAKGPWAALLGAAATVIGQSPDEKAAETLAEKGSRKIAQKLARGYTVAIDLCSGQQYTTSGELPAGELPQPPIPPRGRRWKDNERVELMPGGIDLSGPYSREDMPLGFEIEAEEDGVVARVICATEAREVARAFSKGQEIPEVDALTGDVVQPGAPETLRIDDASCDVVLYTRPSEKSAKFAYMAYSHSARARPLVPCP